MTLHYRINRHSKDSKYLTKVVWEQVKGRVDKGRAGNRAARNELFLLKLYFQESRVCLYGSFWVFFWHLSIVVESRVFSIFSIQSIGLLCWNHCCPFPILISTQDRTFPVKGNLHLVGAGPISPSYPGPNIWSNQIKTSSAFNITITLMCVICLSFQHMTQFLPHNTSQHSHIYHNRHIKHFTVVNRYIYKFL